MNDTISRAAALDAIRASTSKYMGFMEMEMYTEDDAVEAIKNLPSAQSEIILCKDCKHRPTATEAEKGIYWGFSVEFPDEVCPLQCEDGWYNGYPGDEFYCGNAERREEK